VVAVSAAIVNALEALDAGDVAEARAILVSALEDSEPPQADRFPCPYCSFVGRFPGERSEHVERCHLGVS
jgi:hypothetical protein